ncbi:type II toxin-antitoxin system VapC family toxin [Magnetospirillum sulfuroxidans]|uniref:Ribonuclease VapC n=1 Tax=Magnetospirillum sulfuroxidans TaxID=611300 RepID=A0ABS5IJD6_9PROT|nr:type II toxin-antitoxin system VapC family toxin [Magnetospirillum sulfuroxidans]MBR9973898.1 type II toxin-antitoxin system VapC family toxin [Magnetospirillum sulfuroxidans]
MFLLDTNVVSELRKVKSGRADKGVVAWASALDAGTLFLSAITIMELEIGILQIERRDASQAALLRAWMETQVVRCFTDRILPVDLAVAQRCAALHVPDPRSERDAMIAATALVHGMTVATRNVADFERTNVRLFNPWQFLC